MSQDQNKGVVPRWAWLGGLALGFSLVHVLFDYQIGLFGQTSDDVSWVQATLAFLLGALYVIWGVSFAMAQGGTWRRSGLVSLLMLALAWSFLANGLVGVLACLPPCSGAFPYQDVAHLGNIIFGGWASYATWARVRATSGGISWLAPSVVLALVVALFSLQGLLFASTR